MNEPPLTVRFSAPFFYPSPTEFRKHKNQKIQVRTGGIVRRSKSSRKKPKPLQYDYSQLDKKKVTIIPKEDCGLKGHNLSAAHALMLVPEGPFLTEHLWDVIEDSGLSDVYWDTRTPTSGQWGLSTKFKTGPLAGQ